MQQQLIPKRARQSALALFAALALVLVVHLAIGLSTVLLFGLVGGLVGSLVVIGLDLLRSAQHTMNTALSGRPKNDDTGKEGR